MNKKLTWVEAGLIIALFGATYAAIFMVAAHYYPGDKHGDTATWVSGFAAFLAFGGTIWIASAEARSREALALRTAQLFAAGMVLRLLHAKSMMEHIKERLKEIALVDEPPSSLTALASKIEEIDLWTIDELMPLVALPEIAVRLAEARDQLLTSKRIFTNLQTRTDIRSPEGRQAFAESAIGPMGITEKKLSESLERCEFAARNLHINVGTVS